MEPEQEPDASIMNNEQQWPEDAGVPEYADEYGAISLQDIPQVVGLFQVLQIGWALLSVLHAQIGFLTQMPRPPGFAEMLVQCFMTRGTLMTALTDLACGDVP